MYAKPFITHAEQLAVSLQMYSHLNFTCANWFCIRANWFFLNCSTWFVPTNFLRLFQPWFVPTMVCSNHGLFQPWFIPTMVCSNHGLF